MRAKRPLVNIEEDCDWSRGTFGDFQESPGRYDVYFFSNITLKSFGFFTFYFPLNSMTFVETDNEVPFKRGRYHTVLVRSVSKSDTERGCIHAGTEKIKRTVPKQVQKLGGMKK